jgi:hypothetical protein
MRCDPSGSGDAPLLKGGADDLIIELRRRISEKWPCQPRSCFSNSIMLFIELGAYRQESTNNCNLH